MPKRRRLKNLVKNGRSKWAVFGEAGKPGFMAPMGTQLIGPMSPGTDELCGPVCGHLWGWVFEDWSLRQSPNFFEPEGMSVKYTGKPQICLNCQVKSVNYDTQMPLQAVDEAGGVRSNQELSKFESWQIAKSLKYNDMMISANMCIHKFSRTHHTSDWSVEGFCIHCHPCQIRSGD